MSEDHAGVSGDTEREGAAADRVCLYLRLREAAGLPSSVDGATVARVRGMIRGR